MNVEKIKAALRPMAAMADRLRSGYAKDYRGVIYFTGDPLFRAENFWLYQDDGVALTLADCLAAHDALRELDADPAVPARKEVGRWYRSVNMSPPWWRLSPNGTVDVRFSGGRVKESADYSAESFHADPHLIPVGSDPDPLPSPARVPGRWYKLAPHDNGHRWRLTDAGEVECREPDGRTFETALTPAEFERMGVVEAVDVGQWYGRAGGLRPDDRWRISPGKQGRDAVEYWDSTTNSLHASNLNGLNFPPDAFVPRDPPPGH